VNFNDLLESLDAIATEVKVRKGKREEKTKQNKQINKTKQNKKIKIKIKK